ncbi:integrase/recombinase xerD homolog isoform X1 [Haliotis cracherodii]|uniref:integrase/recombinase xerD homolog isoform X1 n=1 Tax=Haliotis cracherodii TaxID=6455 RepID=UPI0039EA8327
MLPGTARDLADQIPDLLNCARADSTSRKYHYGFKAWQRWANSNSICVDVPVQPLHCAIYLVAVMQRNDSFSSVQTAFYSMRHVHNLLGLPSPTDNSLVRNVLEAAKRKLSKPKCKKEPITVDILEKLVDVKQHSDCLKDIRIVAMSLVAYAGFLRSAELLNLKRCDIIFYESYMTVFIEKSKTDMYRDGAWLLISRTRGKLCPVSWLETYVEAACIDNESQEYLFRNLSKCKTSYVLRKQNSSMSYTRLREEFIEAFAPFVRDISKYGLHSLRAGGATAAANNGVPDRMFKRHGRWKSENAKDGYVKDSVEHRLSVSMSLGL